ncbi:hypothetical protein SETIT_8G211200v2 [Setaria italica]|uniref:Pentacotripeptide-repeat region of PRORP domain-containing protein n=1 Tax=Setaria italica TaxID=4555 RepID=K3ZM84_SETIT|nr:hypothetical protein SETIT_8G211200v2 [Setaria italica]
MELTGSHGRLPRHLHLLHPRHLNTIFPSPSYLDPETPTPERFPVRAPPDEQVAAWVTRLHLGRVSPPGLCSGFHHAPESYFAGPCLPDLRLFNACLRFCCDRRSLFPLAFDMFNKMRAMPAVTGCRPDVEIYMLLLSAIVRCPPASMVNLIAVRSLSCQMKAFSVAYARCVEVDDALKVFRREMPLYGCEPNEFTYDYIVKAMFQGWADKGMVYFAEKREKGFVPSGGVYMIAELRRVLLDMLDCKRKPDMITYRTLLAEMSRAGQTEQAFEVLEELKGRKRGPLDQRMYSELLDGLHWIS